jgi:hypothetical protein
MLLAIFVLLTVKIKAITGHNFSPKYELILSNQQKGFGRSKISGKLNFCVPLLELDTTLQLIRSKRCASRVVISCLNGSKKDCLPIFPVII